jgi:hypothetical protein
MKKGSMWGAAWVILAVLGMLLLAMPAAADVVTNVNSGTVTATVAGTLDSVPTVTTPPMPAGAQPVLIRLQKVGATMESDSCPGTFQLVSVTVAGAVADSGTVIVNRKNGSITNALVTVTASSGAGTGTCVDADGFANAHLIYANRSGASYSNADPDKIVLTGTATNAIVELKGWRWY